MALPASPTLISSKLEVKLVRIQPFRLHRRLLLGASRGISPLCSVKITNSQFGDPRNVKLQFSIAKERLWEATPDAVKDFPWKKAEDVLLKRLLVIGQKALKWSLIALYIASFASDVVFSIFRNQELMIPFGLLVGCLMTDFFKEVAREIVRTPEENGLNLPLLGISCFFVLVKVISSYFALKKRVFLLHIANGGLLQVLWLWRNSSKENNKGNEETSVTNQDA